MAKRLFVGSLPYSATSAQIEELFSQVGKISSVNLITDKFSGQSKGFAFVEMSTEEEAKEAIAKFNNFELDGRKIVVNEARPREDRNRSGGDRGDNRRSFNRSRSW
ncbi:RNA-binding protein [Candidatus Curtissbacteria bacterium]|nr:RNA-binding protein [Candidatus Curtissbacteria bacterium]